MTARFYALLTHVGAAKLANATALGTRLDITQMAVGDGGGALPAPNPAQTQLIGEKRRAALNALSIDPVNTSQIIAEQVIPENEGGWWIREIGLYDSAGDLVAIANCAETYKPQLQEGSGRTQTIRMILIVSSTEAVTLKIDPSVVLATRKYVDDKVIEVKQYADNVLADHAKSRNHPDATLSEKGFVTLSNATDSNSETEAATPRAVKAVTNAAVTALSDHVRSANPHDQYLQIENSLSEIKALGAIAVAETLKNLDLKGAAQREVGTAATQIPDMSSFASSAAPTGWMKRPDGLIEQWGESSFSRSNDQFFYADAFFPIAFPNKVLNMSVTLHGITDISIIGKTLAADMLARTWAAIPLSKKNGENIPTAQRVMWRVNGY